MQQFNVDIFDRTLTYVANEQTAVGSIDDDYLSPQTNAITIPNVDADVSAGYYIRLQNEKTSFFGIIVDVSPGEFTTVIQFSSFISVFNETILFWLRYQGTEAGHNYSLEWTLKHCLDVFYAENSDTFMRLPITVSIDSGITRAVRWSLGIRSDKEGLYYTIVNLYSDLIIPALKKYGISISVRPDFNAKNISLVITKSKKNVNIDGKLDNVTVRTLKYTNRPIGTNKLDVINGLHPTNSPITYYAHSDMTFDTDNRDRITPVTYETRMVTPSEDTTASFQESALDEAYNVFSGSNWDNLIEIEADPDDENVLPMELELGQKITLWYEDASYVSILTGRIIEESCVVLLLGSERIDYTKRSKGGR